MKQELDVIALQPVYEKPTDQVRLARPGLALDNAEGMRPRRIRQSQKDSLLIAPINLAGMAARYFEISYRRVGCQEDALRSEEQTSELKSLMRISYAVFCLKKK